ncbi:hypothetical protein [Altibacter lentus]|uniref:hypothetical protein n=1 Tax=Altibacter lentus TaxID=1223410 RepID=UPI00054EDF41|nr:hypothetical protein [Altibacter lentus]
MRKERNLVIGILAVFVILILGYYFIWSFAPGSYARAEIYEFDVSENELIEIIQEFKKENSTLNLSSKVIGSNGEEQYLNDHKKGYWHSFYFYYPDKNQIIHTWTRPNSNNKTDFAFVAVNDGLILGNWKNVNDSFFWWKNTSMKKEFENRILKQIKDKVE